MAKEKKPKVAMFLGEEYIKKADQVSVKMTAETETNVSPSNAVRKLIDKELGL